MTSTKFTYFAYGSNMLTKRIRYQNPSAVAVGTASLQGYKLDFRLASKRWGGKAATIRASTAAEVCGVLWELDKKHLTTLDDQEGVPKGLYKRFSVKVELLGTDGKATGKSLQAITYQVTDEHLTPESGENKPSGIYKEVMVAGAKEHGLPEEYIKKLETMPDDGTEGTMELGLPLHIKDNVPS